MTERRVIVLGASSLIGDFLLPRLVEAGWKVDAITRRAALPSPREGVKWRGLQDDAHGSGDNMVDGVLSTAPFWISLAPIWTTVAMLPALGATRVRRIVAVSSTSRFTKGDSSNPDERESARRFAESEGLLKTWAESRGIEWVILRPTLIYGGGRDRNVSEIARFIRRFGFFPLLGRADGKRQPVHSEDLAAACVAALSSPLAANRAYDVCGGETLAYREMVERIFAALDRRPVMLSVPLAAFRITITAVRRLPRFRGWNAAMAERMNRDLVFDAAEARRDLGFTPRPFRLERVDLPC